MYKYIKATKKIYFFEIWKFVSTNVHMIVFTAETAIRRLPVVTSSQ